MLTLLATAAAVHVQVEPTDPAAARAAEMFAALDLNGDGMVSGLMMHLDWKKREAKEKEEQVCCSNRLRASALMHVHIPLCYEVACIAFCANAYASATPAAAHKVTLSHALEVARQPVHACCLAAMIIIGPLMVTRQPCLRFPEQIDFLAP